MNQEKKTKYTALGIGLLLTAAAVCSLLWILIPPPDNGGHTADIYQNGELIHSISLKDVDQPYTFTVTG